MTDAALTGMGKKQVRGIKDLLRGENIEKMYASDLTRAVQSARILAGKKRIIQKPALREICFGIFEGLTYTECKDRFDPLYAHWVSDPLSVTIPEGESVFAVANRVRAVWLEILKESEDRTIAVVSHAGPIRIILCDILRMPLSALWSIPAQRVMINRIEHEHGIYKHYWINEPKQ